MAGGQGLEQITVPAYAKINLALDVLGKRSDGYHEVQMVMQTISLRDTVTVSLSEEITLTSNSEDIPLGQENLAYRAAAMLQRVTGCRKGARIHIDKHIPVAAGLAGGSSNAAAVLLSLNRLWELDLPVGYLAELGSRLGSDVPFCVVGGTCLATGRGERITMLPQVPRLWLVLVNPGFAVATAKVYQEFSPAEVVSRPDVSVMIKAIEKRDRTGIINNMENVLESSTFALYPRVREVKEELAQSGAEKVLMCGSGPTVFAVVGDQEQAYKLKTRLQGKYPFVTVAETI